jgi:hypothetical protein
LREDFMVRVVFGGPSSTRALPVFSRNFGHLINYNPSKGVSCRH